MSYFEADVTLTAEFQNAAGTGSGSIEGEVYEHRRRRKIRQRAASNYRNMNLQMVLSMHRLCGR